MNRSKIVAIVTGAISILLAIAYLILVQLLDFRGEMLPAPQDQLSVNREQGAASREQRRMIVISPSAPSASPAPPLAGITLK